MRKRKRMQTPRELGEYRRATGMSASEFAEIAGVHHGNYLHWEYRLNPPLDALLILRAELIDRRDDIEKMISELSAEIDRQDDTH